MLSEIKRNTDWRFSILQIFCLILLFGISIGYEDDMGRNISIFNLLFNPSNESFVSNIDGFELWSNGISRYTSIMYPILICLGFSLSMYFEKRGARRYILIRERRIRYCFAKAAGAVISGGMLFLIAYMLFGIMIWIRITPMSMLFSMDGSKVISCFIKLGYSFAYGMGLSLFFILVSIYFDDKFELMCFPILVKYLLMIISDRIMAAGMNSDNQLFIHIAEVTLNPENIINDYSSLMEKAESFLIIIVFFMLSVFLMNNRIKRDGKNGCI